MYRFLAAMLLASALVGCASGGQTEMVCPDLITSTSGFLVSPPVGAINVPDNLSGITVQGALVGASQALVTLTPTGGGAVLTIVDSPLFPIPQPGPGQYNLAIPPLAAHTTYTVTISLEELPAGCPGNSSASFGSFTTQ